MAQRAIGHLRLVSPGDTTSPSEQSGGASAPAGVADTDTDAGVEVAPVLLAGRAGPQLMTLQDLGNGRGFLFPLYVSVDQAAGEWFATSVDLSLVGRGEIELDAIDDLRAQVAELYDSLSEMRDSLGAHLLNQLSFLDRLAGVR